MKTLKSVICEENDTVKSDKVKEKVISLLRNLLYYDGKNFMKNDDDRDDLINYLNDEFGTKYAKTVKSIVSNDVPLWLTVYYADRKPDYFKDKHFDWNESEIARYIGKYYMGYFIELGIKDKGIYTMTVDTHKGSKIYMKEMSLNDMKSIQYKYYTKLSPSRNYRRIWEIPKEWKQDFIDLYMDAGKNNPNVIFEQN